MLGAAGFKAATVSYSHPTARLWDFHVAGGWEGGIPHLLSHSSELAAVVHSPTNKRVYTWHHRMLSPGVRISLAQGWPYLSRLFDL